MIFLWGLYRAHVAHTHTVRKSRKKAENTFNLRVDAQIHHLLMFAELNFFYWQRVKKGSFEWAETFHGILISNSEKAYQIRMGSKNQFIKLNWLVWFHKWTNLIGMIDKRHAKWLKISRNSHSIKCGSSGHEQKQ